MQFHNAKRPLSRSHCSRQRKNGAALGEAENQGNEQLSPRHRHVQSRVATMILGLRHLLRPRTVRYRRSLVDAADGPLLGIKRPFFDEARTARSAFCLSARLSLAVTWAGQRGGDGCPRLRLQYLRVKMSCNHDPKGSSPAVRDARPPDLVLSCCQCHCHCRRCSCRSKRQQPISRNRNGCLFLRHPFDAPASHTLGHSLARLSPSSGYRTVVGDRRLARRRPLARSPPGPVPFRFVCFLVSSRLVLPRRSGSTLASELLLSVELEGRGEGQQERE